MLLHAIDSGGMARTYLVFGDIEGKLDVLRVECAKCDRKGRYSVAKLIAKHSRKGNMSAWVSDLKGDCPKRDAAGFRTAATWCVLICQRLYSADGTIGASG
jgi:hypothetical protein